MLKSQIRRYQIGFAVLGILVSLYLTANHYFSVPIICPESQLLDCATVLGSQYAIVFGVPVAVLGVAWFAIMLVLLVAVRKSDYVMYWNVFGFITLFYFWYSELALGTICVWCTSVHIIVIILLALAALYDRSS